MCDKVEPCARWCQHARRSEVNSLGTGAYVGDLGVGVDDHDTSLVEASTTCTTRHLRAASDRAVSSVRVVSRARFSDALLAGQQFAESTAVVFPDAGEDDAFRRHVDALEVVNVSSIQRDARGLLQESHHGEGLGRKQNLDQTAGEQELDDLQAPERQERKYRANSREHRAPP